MNDDARGRARSGVRNAFHRIAPEIDLDAVDPGADLLDEVDLDSVDVANLVVAIHEELGVDIPERDYDEVATLEAMIGYVADRLPPD
jgi:acyl carrier protein